MAKCALGGKKCKQIERLTGKKVTAAYVRGGWPHFWAMVIFEGEQYTMAHWPPFVNYKTGEIEEDDHDRPLGEWADVLTMVPVQTWGVRGGSDCERRA